MLLRTTSLVPGLEYAPPPLSNSCVLKFYLDVSSLFIISMINKIYPSRLFYTFISRFSVASNAVHDPVFSYVYSIYT